MNKLMNMSKKAKILAGGGLIGLCALIAGLSFWVWSNSGVRVEDLSKEYKQVVKSLDGDIFTAESLRVVCAKNKSLDGVNRCEQAKVLENIKAAKEMKKAEIPTSVAELEKSLDSAKEVKEKLATSISNAKDALGKDADKYRSEVVVPLIETIENKIADAKKLAGDNPDNGATLVHKPGELAHVLNIKADELGKDVKRISKNMRDEKVFISQLQDITASLKSSLESLNEAFVMVQNAIGVEPEKQAPVVVPSQKSAAPSGNVNNSKHAQKGSTPKSSNTSSRPATPAKPAHKPAAPAKPAHKPAAPGAGTHLDPSKVVPGAKDPSGGTWVATDGKGQCFEGVLGSDPVEVPCS